MNDANPTLDVMIVDDVELAQQRLQRLLQDLPDVRVCATARDVDQALERIARHRPEVILLDIDLPGGNGFALLERLPDGAPIHIVFCTAHAHFAARAFAADAVDYLLKPIEPARLQEAFRRVFQRRRAGQAPAHYLVLRERDQIRVLPMPAIDWIEAAGNYVCIRVAEQTHVYRESLARLQQRLDPERFIRIHRSRIVNLSRIARLEPLFDGDQRVHLHDGTILVLSRTYREALSSRLAAHG